MLVLDVSMRAVYNQTQLKCESSISCLRGASNGTDTQSCSKLKISTKVEQSSWFFKIQILNQKRYKQKEK